MIYEKKSAVEAVLHFDKFGFKEAFAGKTVSNKEYDRAYKIIKAARIGYVSDTRARFLLETYGGGCYKCSSVFEVEAGSNDAAFGEAAQAFGEALNESECLNCGGTGYDPYQNHSTTVMPCQFCQG